MVTPSIQSESEITPIVQASGIDERIVGASESPVRNGKGGSQSTLPGSCDRELKNLDEEQLKVAIKSAWKKHERLARKDMGPMLYWLRDKLRAQGSRNDLRDRDEGFGAWVAKTIEISRRTADRWADEYGLANDLMKRDPKPTSGHVTKCIEDRPAEDADDFYERELREHGKLIQINCWVSQEDHKQYEEALKTIKEHFKIANDKEAVLKGVQYAAQSLSHGG